MPTTDPWIAESRTTGRSAGHPSQAPMAASSQTSPQPIVSLCRTFSPTSAMAAKKPKPARAPMPASIQLSSAFHSGEIRPSAKSGQVIWCGSSQVSRSMKVSARSAQTKAAKPSVDACGPSCFQTAKTSSAPSTSTSG